MEVKVENSRDGNPIIKVKLDRREIYLSSRYSPLGEAEKVSKSINIKNDLILLTGIGNPYLAYEISKNNPDKTVIVIEPLREIYETVLSNPYFKRLLSNSNIKIELVETTEKLKSLLSDIRYFDYYINPQYKSLFEIHMFEKIINETIHNLEINRNTLIRFGRLWLKNFILSFENSVKAKPVKLLFGTFNEFDVVVVGAGPSLDENKDILKNLYRNSIIISVDTSFSYLISMGIIPDIVVSVDPQMRNVIYNLIKKNYTNTLFVVDTLYPPIIYKFIPYNNIFMFNSPLKVWTLLKDNFNLDKGDILVGGSVICSSIDLANKLGAKNIILIGGDFCFPNLRIYSKGNYYELSKFITSNIFNTYDPWYILSKYPLILRLSKTNTPVFTDPRMLTFKEWIEKYVTTNNIKLINTSSNGLKIQSETSSNINTSTEISNLIDNNNINSEINKQSYFSSRRERIENIKRNLISIDIIQGYENVIRFIHRSIKEVFNKYEGNGIYGVVDTLTKNEFLKYLFEIGLQNILLREYTEKEFLAKLNEDILYVKNLYERTYF
ncbi:MAG: DUF115 domain-containing protein [Brevinematales bacterium]|nr:DUF115 domain-containing protein [Brevinematales bacterium]